jgi:hypothetical protein
MEVNQSAELLNALLERTERGTLDWTETFDEDVYQTSLTNAVVQVIKKITSNRHGDQQTYVVAILNDSGRLLSEIRSDSLRNSIFDDGPDAALRKLYESARSKALRVPETMGSILSELKGAL